MTQSTKFVGILLTLALIVWTRDGYGNAAPVDPVILTPANSVQALNAIANLNQPAPVDISALIAKELDSHDKEIGNLKGDRLYTFISNLLKPKFTPTQAPVTPPPPTIILIPSAPCACNGQGGGGPSGTTSAPSGGATTTTRPPNGTPSPPATTTTTEPPFISPTPPSEGELPDTKH